MGAATAARRATYQGLRSTSCQQANTRRPPGIRWRRMAPNAAVGSSKNMTPNWLTARSKGPPPSEPVCTSICTNSRVGDTGLGRPGSGPVRAAVPRCRSRSPHRPARPGLASARVRIPPPQPMSHTRCPGRAPTASSRKGDTSLVSRSRRGQAAAQCSSFHRLNSPSLATAPRYPARVGSALCASAWSSCPPIGGPRRAGSGSGPTAAGSHGVDLRPHPLGRHARRAVARRRARARRGGRGDAAHPAGHARGHAQLPPPRHAGPRSDHARRPQRRPPRPRAGAGQRGLRRGGPRAGAVAAGGTAGPLRGLPRGAAADPRRGAVVAHDHPDRALRGRGGAEHAGHACSGHSP